MSPSRASPSSARATAARSWFPIVSSNVAQPSASRRRSTMRPRSQRVVEVKRGSVAVPGAALARRAGGDGGEPAPRAHRAVVASRIGPVDSTSHRCPSGRASTHLAGRAGPRRRRWPAAPRRRAAPGRPPRNVRGRGARSCRPHPPVVRRRSRRRRAPCTDRCPAASGAPRPCPGPRRRGPRRSPWRLDAGSGRAGCSRGPATGAGRPPARRQRARGPSGNEPSTRPRRRSPARSASVAPSARTRGPHMGRGSSGTRDRGRGVEPARTASRIAGSIRASAARSVGWSTAALGTSVR